MQSLTKEQAHWLIDLLKNNMDSCGEVEGNELYSGFKVAMDIINRCTEDEFPRFEMRLGNTDREHYLTIRKASEESLFLDSPLGSIHLRYVQFRQFAEGCNRIVEWLEGKENENT